MDYRALLNTRQYEAVTSTKQYVRIIAGAGSGKTRVLTYRLAYLIDQMGADPRSIVAIAFTNKVANEMKVRAEQILGDQSKKLSVSTFHSFCALFLRREIDVLGFPNSFTIIDDEDQKQLIKSIAVTFGFKKNDEIVSIASAYIANNKCKGLYPSDIAISEKDDDTTKDCHRFFVAYEERKNASFNLDFDDLLLYTIHILENFPDVRAKYQNRIQHILIDEYQDINDVQFKLVRYLMNDKTCLYVVGDPDQTIYTWRGANQKLILDFEVVFRDVETIILDENYRSTSRILDTANTLIANNKNRVPKNLFTNNGEGARVVAKTFYTREEEAKFVADQIKFIFKREKGNPNAKIAILYRAAYLTLPFEKEFIRRSIPYAVYGSVKFFERREIKDILAYLRLIYNEHDDVSFERIYNTPRRGIGEQTFNKYKTFAAENRIPMYQLAKNLENYPELNFTSKVRAQLKLLVYDIEDLKTKIETAKVKDITVCIQEFLETIGYYNYINTLEEPEGRLENMATLLGDIKDFLSKNPSMKLSDYLQNIALQSAQDEIQEDVKVLMMTIHVAKGLEFDYVFVINMVEGIFPSERTLEDSGHDGLEEERRLCYVAMTRAKKELYLTTNGSFAFALDARSTPSRFFNEANLSLVQNASSSSSFFDHRRSSNNYDFSQKSPANDGYFPDDGGFDDFQPVAQKRAENGIKWSVGDELYHDFFGGGKVLEVKGDYIVVNFYSHGRKTILGSHPTLSKKEVAKA